MGRRRAAQAAQKQALFQCTPAQGTPKVGAGPPNARGCSCGVEVQVTAQKKPALRDSALWVVWLPGSGLARVAATGWAVMQNVGFVACFGWSRRLLLLGRSQQSVYPSRHNKEGSHALGNLHWLTCGGETHSSNLRSGKGQ